uniref:inositol hexakisphosphate kinase 1-like n=1 Tax=Myxine glutinosa TaxID=7769 RepID=UPI0035900C75
MVKRELCVREAEMAFPAAQSRAVSLHRSASGGIPLRPFVHQVAGHTSILSYDSETICKPLIRREQRFYQSLPPEMYPFTPQYKGVVSVGFEQTSDGSPGLVAYPYLGKDDNSADVDCDHIDNDSTFSQIPSLVSVKRALDYHENLENQATCVQNIAEVSVQLHIETQVTVHVKCNATDSTVDNADDDIRNSIPAKKVTWNPWWLQCHVQQLSRMWLEAQDRKMFNFLLLENVVSRFARPCVLDLKMGTRQHGDDASEEKKARQMEKCAQSTSAQLGVRLCGMQVYQASTRDFLCQNKYYGRSLSLDGFRASLLQFLHNGQRLRTDLLQPILLQLRRLHKVLEAQPSYRFYSSSLLIIYDGALVTDSSQPLPSSSSPPSPVDHVDVRMIDFAHTTYKGFRNDAEVYDGPDKGYIFGMQNVIGILEEIYHQNM